MAEPQYLSTDPHAGLPASQIAASYAPQERPTLRGAQPAGAYEMSDGPTPEPSNLSQMLGPLAHPETFTDFARLLTLPVDAVRKAAASALAMAAAKGVASSAKQIPAAAARGAVNVAAGAGDMVHPDVIGAVSPRAGKVVEIAQKMRAARPAVVPEAVAEAPAATIQPTGSGAALPDQKALNEAALAARRAAYQATQKSGPVAVESIVKASGKMQLTAPEFKEFQRLIQRGVSLPDAEQAVKMARELAGKLGVEPPPVSATKFTKGWKS